MTSLEDELTQLGHILIITGVIAAYLKSQRVEGLIKTQQETIDALKKGFEACKENLNLLERKINKKVSK